MNKKSIFSEIIKEENFNVAIKKIKKNGKKAMGIDKMNLEDFLNKQNPYQIILNRFQKFKPKGVRRVDIPKGDGKTRPLGILTIEDKIIQMMMKNILEPICERKFHDNSYGFRPNRSTEHAIAWNNSLINIVRVHFCVDIDIKGFFDNINHKKLLKQCIKIGIKDMKVIMILKEMLKAPIHYPNGDIKIPNKGTPQGGIISPLLSNIYLNELDWWISNQWKTFKTKKKYSTTHNKHVSLRNKKLKEVYLVRYADDFKLMCKNRESAEIMFKNTKTFLKNKLKLEISKKKSKIVNLRKQKSNFLGFSIKAVKKGKKGKRVAHTWMSEKARKKSIVTLRTTIKEIQKGCFKEVLLYNSKVIGIQNYYRIATHISKSLNKIGYIIDRIISNRLRQIAKNHTKDERYRERYKGYNYKTWTVRNITLFTIQAQRHKNPLNFSKKRKNKKLTIKQNISNEVEKLYEKIAKSKTDEINSEWSATRAIVYHKQQCKCYVTDEFLKNNEFAVHHRVPKEFGGKDNIENLVLVSKEIHKLLHMKDPKFSSKKFDILRKEILNCKSKN